MPPFLAAFVGASNQLADHSLTVRGSEVVAESARVSKRFHPGRNPLMFEKPEPFNRLRLDFLNKLKY